MHPMLIVFPLGLLVTALICDILYFVTANQDFAIVSFYAIAGGVIGGLAAAVFGLWDWLAIPAGTRARAVGLWHGLGNVVVVVLFAASWLLRRGDPAYLPTGMSFVLALLGGGLGLVTSWLGGELVDRLGVGVDTGANLNAPSSLSGQPASATRAPSE
ncbi:MAG: DUF2231 domain-containing protein [Ardenticatenaceae bacterium]